MKTKGKRKHLRCCQAGILVSSLLFMLCGCQREEPEPEPVVTTYETFEETVAGVETTRTTEDGESVPIQLTLWYNDIAAAPYYEAAAADFHERYGVEVVCTYVDDVKYLEAVNQANINGSGPDLFIASNDAVRKLWMAELTKENALYTEDFWNDHYPLVAQQAMNSSGKMYGYPVYFDTSMMIYDAAVTSLPQSFGSITDFAVNFVDETNTRVLFRWDIGDPFYDYLFLGTGAEVLGENGEDTAQFNINNESVVQNMTYYQSLHEYFSIDVETSSYEQVKEELVNGTLVYGIVKTDVLSDWNTFGSSYAICPVPPLSDTLPVQSLSVTYGAFVNSYTNQPEYANLFGAYLSYEYAQNQFGLTKCVSARADIDRPEVNEQLVFQQYCTSKSVPKALENGDFWVHMEICFKNIWNGADVASELNSLQEKMTERLK